MGCGVLAVFEMNRLLGVINFLLQLQSIVSTTIDANTGIIDSTNKKARVAFVFAGSARSFVMPPVHESIRHNLLNAMYVLYAI